MKTIRWCIYTCILLMGCSPLLAQDFTVDAFSVDIYVNKEGYFDVVENYDVNFEYHKHGIYRDILTQYTLLTEDGTQERRQIEISNIEVPRHMFEATSIFGQKIKGALQIKIGDPNKTVVGPVHYEIRYRVENAFLFEKEATRFYWNLKPSDWYAPFKNISFSIHVPAKATIDGNDVRLYTGPVGATTPSDAFTIKVSDGLVTGVSKPDFTSHRGEAVTILLDLPVDSIAENKPFWPFWSHYGWIIILGLVAGLYYRLFQRYGKDDPAPAVISYFPPEKMDSAMAGFLINDQDDTSDLISLIPYWGQQGLLVVEEIDKKGWFAKDDTRLIKMKDLPTDAPAYQQTVFQGLFGFGETEVLVSDLKNTFYTTMNEAKAALKKAAQRYYNPLSRKVYFYSIAGIILVHILLALLFFYFWGFIAFFFAIISAGLLLLLNRFMVKKNPKGTELLRELKGFKKFIKTAETNRLKMLLKEDPSYFESTMAYALTFGYFEGWARKFESMDIAPPKWYHYSGAHMGMHQFSRSFSNTIKATSTTMVSSPSRSSGGGGSSGGGFGGGGGGSW